MYKDLTIPCILNNFDCSPKKNNTNKRQIKNNITLNHILYKRDTASYLSNIDNLLFNVSMQKQLLQFTYHSIISTLKSSCYFKSIKMLSITCFLHLFILKFILFNKQFHFIHRFIHMTLQFSFFYFLLFFFQTKN